MAAYFGDASRVLAVALLPVPDYPAAPSFDATMARMFERTGVASLPAHLEQVFGVKATKLQPLDVGVFRVDRLQGAPVVVRLFSERRTHARALGDLAVLQELEIVGFPAELPCGREPISIHQGQAVLVTDFVRAAPKSAPPRRPLVALGALIGRLHQLPLPTGVADRPAGALHHYAEGTPADELQAAQRWLQDIEPRVTVADRDQLDVLRRALADADDSSGLSEAFIHPDPVPKNAVFTKDGPVLVDWAGAGRGPRLASLALVLRSSWAAVPFMRGYATHIELEAEERRRARDVLMVRAFVDIAFRVCREPDKVRPQVKRLPALRKQTDELTAAVLAAA